VFHDPPVDRHQDHHCRRHPNYERQPKSSPSPTADQQLRVPLLRSEPEQQKEQQQ
jgi:hypothetical protein